MFDLAAMDFADRHYDEAVAKLKAIFAVETDPVRRAACLGAAGDIAMQIEQAPLAVRLYRSALALATPAQDFATLGPLTMSAGQACMRLGFFGEAARYFEQAERIAA